MPQDNFPVMICRKDQQNSYDLWRSLPVTSEVNSDHCHSNNDPRNTCNHQSSSVLRKLSTSTITDPPQSLSSSLCFLKTHNKKNDNDHDHHHHQSSRLKTNRIPYHHWNGCRKSSIFLPEISLPNSSILNFLTDNIETPLNSFISSSSSLVKTSKYSRSSPSPSSSLADRLCIVVSFLLLTIVLIEIKTIHCYETIIDNDLVSFQSTLCDQSRQIALGMESGSIPDSALSASSSYNEQSVGPQNARLNRELNGGAWCPASQIDGSNSGHEWIQINFTEPYLITMISTQGRFGNGLGVEYAEYFWLEYTRDGYKWSRWRDQFGEDDIKGNSDTYSIVQTVLSVPLIGVIGVRLLPISSYIRTCCLRFELHGCPYQDGLVSYSMMDGQLNGKFGDLIDRTYDGYRSETGYLSNGLGQLTDGIKGDDDYKINRGYEWIGWEANGQNSLSITFQFDTLRNFTSAMFHCHNLFSKDIQVFSAAMIWFSLDGRQWSSKPEEFEYMPDLIMEHARDVIIHLHNRIGRFVRFDFRFASTWLLISEANFDSFPLSNHVVSINELDFVDSVPITTTSIQGAYDTFYGEQAFVFSFVAICGLFLILFALFVFVWFNRKRKEKLTGSEYTTVPLKDVSPTTHYCEPNDLQNGIFMGLPFRRSFLPNQNGLSSPFVSSHSGLDNDPEYAVPDLIGNNILQSSNKKSSPKYFISSEKPTINQLIPSYQKSSIIFNKNRSNNGWSITKNPNHNINELNDGNKNSDTSQENTFNNDVANTEDHDDDGKARYYASSDVFLRQNQSDPRSLPPTNDFVNISNRIGALNYLDKRKNNLMSIAPLITESNTLMNFSTPQSSFSSPLLASSTATKPFKPSTNGSYDSSLTPNSSTSTNQNVSSMISLKDSLTSKIPLLNENDVSIINGHFGYSALGDCELGYLHQRNKERKIVVLETVIGNDKNLRDEFMLKMNEKWRLSNQCSEKFAQIFGYISKYDYLAMLVEYGDDDLKNFLRSTSQLVIRTVDLLKFGMQIAEAMHTLNQIGFTHRDLAARNCLIYSKTLKIKLSDTGAMNKSYKKEYFQETLPIRWMSFETIINGVCTTKSQVYSFGVTLWEIMKYCQMLPHQFLSDEELLNEIFNTENIDDDCHHLNEDNIDQTDPKNDNSSTFYNHPFNNSADQRSQWMKDSLCLSKPKDCPEEIYDLILECTQRSEESRPDFPEIIYFLQKKIQGHR